MLLSSVKLAMLYFILNLWRWLSSFAFTIVDMKGTLAKEFGSYGDTNNNKHIFYVFKWGFFSCQLCILWTPICICLGFYRTHAIVYWNRRLPYSEILMYILRILNVYRWKFNLCELALSSHPFPLNITKNCWQRLNI